MAKKIRKICRVCGKEFEVYPYRKDSAKYCSRECCLRVIGERDFYRTKEYRDKMRESLLGREHTWGDKISKTHKERGIKPISTEEIRKKISNANRGRKVSEETKRKISQSNKGRVGLKGKDNPWYGKKHRQDSKDKMRVAHIGKPTWNKDICGNRSHSWKGGVSKLPYTYDWNRVSEEMKKRDNYRCQECNEGSKGKLAVHHIDYDKKNNKEDNLITLCLKCNSRANWNRDYWKKYYGSKIKCTL